MTKNFGQKIGLHNIFKKISLKFHAGSGCFCKSRRTTDKNNHHTSATSSIVNCIIPLTFSGILVRFCSAWQYQSRWTYYYLLLVSWCCFWWKSEFVKQRAIYWFVG